MYIIKNKSRYLRTCLSLLLLQFYINGCSGGIEPEPEKVITTGFGGTVTFSGTWDPAITRVHLVVFKNPLNSVGDFNPFNLAYVSDSIPIGANSWTYNTNYNKINDVLSVTGGTYAYAAVAYSTTPALSLIRDDWFVVGIYKIPTDTLHFSSVVVPAGSFVTGIDIHCDFDNPPPQPPE